MKLSIITVTWNSAEHIVEQMRSVEAAAGELDYEQIIIDNGSYDETVAKIREAYPTVRLIVNKINRGFAYANNVGYQASRGEYILFLNPDTLLMPSSLAAWVEKMEQMPNVVLSGPKLVDSNGNINPEALPRRFPSLLNQLVTLTFLRNIFPSVVDRYRMKGFNPHQEQVVDSVRGSCLMARRSFLTMLGFAFDPRYFIWFEDVDVCKEAYRHGHEVRYLAEVVAIDLVGRSFAKRSTWWKRKQFFKSLVTYLWKWSFFSKR